MRDCWHHPVAAGGVATGPDLPGPYAATDGLHGNTQRGRGLRQSEERALAAQDQPPPKLDPHGLQVGVVTAGEKFHRLTEAEIAAFTARIPRAS